MFAAPFYGEFGWEVALWAPHLRWLQHNHHRELTVLCRPGHTALYEDFAHAVIETKPPDGITRSDCQNVWLHGAQIKGRGWLDEVARVMRKRIGKARIYTPHDMQVRWDPVPRTKQVVHRPFAYELKEPLDRDLILVHARACAGKQEERNWSPAKWDELCKRLTFELGYTVVAIGSLEQSYVPVDAVSDRGCSLGSLIRQLCRASMVVGPSSGPLHLANQCDAQVVWWSGNAKDVPRYEEVWNPFDCANVCAARSWDPSIDEVWDAITRLRD